MSEYVELTYPVWHHETFHTFIGGNKSKLITFPDALPNITGIDFTDTVDADGDSVIIRNTTKTKDGEFSVYVLDSSGETVVQKTIDVDRIGKTNNIRRINEIGKLTFSSSTVKYIKFTSEVNNANIRFWVDDDSEFKMFQQRSLLTLIPGTTTVSWSSPETGDLRMVQRVENSYRNIADDSDVVVTSTDSTIQNLEPNHSYTFVLQKNGTEWYDIAGNTVVTKQVSISLDSWGTRHLSVSWDEYYAGATYALSAISSTSSKTIETNETSATIRELEPGTSYTIQLKSV